MSSFDFEQHRRPDGSIDLAAAYMAYRGMQPHELQRQPRVVDFFKMIDETHPLRSRQAAVIAIAAAHSLARET